MKRTLPIVALLALVACATTGSQQRVTVLTISGTTLDATGLLFEATLAGMTAASDAHELTREQAIGWNDFLARWKVAYPNACAAWRSAKAKADAPALEEASAALVTLLGQLNSWAAVVRPKGAP